MVNSPWNKLTRIKAQAELTIEDLQDDCCDGHRGYRNKMFLAILIAESPCRPNASHQVLAQSKLPFWNR